MIDYKKLRKMYKIQFIHELLGVNYYEFRLLLKDNSFSKEQIRKLKKLKLWITK